MPAKQLPQTREQLMPLLRRTLSPTDAARVAPWVMPAVGFHESKPGREPAALGTTRFGGRPDLPDGVNWPDGPDGPLAFLGQVALAEVAPLDVDRVLPPAGTVWFFYNIFNYAWGFKADDRDRFAVLFAPRGVALRRREFPEDIRGENRVAQARRATPYLRWQLPTADPLAKETLGVGEMPTLAEPAADPFTEKYWKLTSDLAGLQGGGGSHQLLGWANGIYQQGEDCRLMCELAAGGFPEEGTAAFAAARENRRRWRCLLQIDEDPDLYNDAWADCGTVAFMIRDEDLRNGDFSRCWCVLSST
jgi:uncharacterized protein YwqG